MQTLQKQIDEAFSNSALSAPSAELLAQLDTFTTLLNDGTIRAAEKINGAWQTNDWVKKGILLTFKFSKNAQMPAGTLNFYDKIPLKHTHFGAEDFSREDLRVVPGAIVRAGAFIGSKTILMPSFVNIGAYIDTGCMIDTWASVGSCAQIGKNVHLSGGAGIGGVLEPLQARPTIIEDNCFIGARSEIVEGVIIEAGSVLSMGVYIGQSTPIYDRAADKLFYGRVPAGSVVVPGTLPSKNGKYNLYAAIIVKQVDEKTRAKTSINELLRENYDE